ncbi:MAG: DUF1850 domain-containing protein [Deltaproteobacteria bacterium]|nr:DUF1850 domain-containing protein [Deltaproteobacteria bacterium]
MKKNIFAFIFFFLMFFFTSFPSSADSLFVLNIFNSKTSSILFKTTIQPGESFFIETIHSLAKTPYTHIFKVDEKGEIFLSGAIYESEGGGYPLATDGSFSYKNGKFFMDNMNRFVGILRFRVSPISRETFKYHTMEIPLYNLVSEGTLLYIQVEMKKE